MTAMPPKGRLFTGMLALPIGIVAMILWGLGHVIKNVGITLWMFGHRACRADNCACGECRDFPSYRSIWRIK